MPIGPTRRRRRFADRPPASREPATFVHRAWKLHFDDAHHSLVSVSIRAGIASGATADTVCRSVCFLPVGVSGSGTRLRTFVEKAAQATLVGDVFDDGGDRAGLLNSSRGA